MSKRMTTEIQSITTALPKGSVAYVFGSSTRKNRYPSDLDILVVYDSEECQPRQAYDMHDAFYSGLCSLIKTTVDLTLLSFDEEKSSSFIDSCKCIPLLKWAHEL